MLLENFVYPTVTAVPHFIGQDWISKTVYCIFVVWWPVKYSFALNSWKLAKESLLRGPMVIIYYIEIFCIGAGRGNSILLSLLLLVAKTVIPLLRVLLNPKCWKKGKNCKNLNISRMKRGFLLKEKHFFSFERAIILCKNKEKIADTSFNQYHRHTN